MSKLRDFWHHVIHKDKAPATPPPKEETPVVTLIKIQVTGERDPYHPTIAEGEHEPFNAEGFYSDGSRKDLTAVDWSSSAPAVASIDAKGKATGKSPGDARITAKDAATGISGTADITVTEAVAGVLKSIAVKPKDSDFFPKQGQLYEATAVYSDGATRDITAFVEWSSSDPDVAKLGDSSYCQMGKAGSAMITAKDPKTGIHGSTKVTVETPAADLQRISLQVHATTFRGQLMNGFASATLSAAGAKAVHCPSKHPVSGEVYVWTDLYVKPAGKVEFSVKATSKNGAAPHGSASYKLSAGAEYLVFDAEQQEGVATTSAPSEEEAIKKAGAKETMDGDIVADDQGNGQWKISWGTDVFDMKLK